SVSVTRVARDPRLIVTLHQSATTAWAKLVAISVLSSVNRRVATAPMARVHPFFFTFSSDFIQPRKPRNAPHIFRLHELALRTLGFGRTKTREPSNSSACSPKPTASDDRFANTTR